MPTVRRVLGWKIPFSALMALPLLFLPLRYFPDLQIPEYDQVSLIFIRLLGASRAALLVVQVWGFFDHHALRGAVVSAIAETLLVAMTIWHFVFYGTVQNWPVLGKALLLVEGGLAALFALLLTVTGIGTLFGDAGATVAKPAPTGGADSPSASSEREPIWPGSDRTV